MVIHVSVCDVNASPTASGDRRQPLSNCNRTEPTRFSDTPYVTFECVNTGGPTLLWFCLLFKSWVSQQNLNTWNGNGTLRNWWHQKNTKQSRAASWTWPVSLSIKTSQNTKHNSAVFTSPSPPLPLPDRPVPGAGLWHLSRIISCSCGISASLPSNMLGLNVEKCTNQCLLSSSGASQLQPDTQLVNETSRNQTRHPNRLFMRLRGEEACIVCIVRPVKLSNPARRIWQNCIKSKWVIK